MNSEMAYCTAFSKYPLTYQASTELVITASSHLLLDMYENNLGYMKCHLFELKNEHQVKVRDHSS